MNESPLPSPIKAPKDQRTWAMFSHLTAFAGYLMPFGNLVGPLIVWLIKKDQMPFVDHQGKESLNFQITMTIAAAISGLLFVVVIGIFMLVAVVILNIVFVIVASVKANDGVAYRYPMCIRLIR